VVKKYSHTGYLVFTIVGYRARIFSRGSHLMVSS